MRSGYFGKAGQDSAGFRAVGVDLQDAPRIETGAAIIALIDERIGFGDQPPLLPRPILAKADDTADGNEQNQPDTPKDDLQDRALDFIVRMFQVA